MIHDVFAVGILQCNCSILGDELSREAIVVDPGANIGTIMARLAKHGLTAKQIVVTHAHIDHIAGASELKRLTGAPILYNPADLPLVAMMDVQAGWIGVATPEVSAPDQALEHGTVFGVDGVSGAVLHTPGHTPGSICLYFSDQALLLAGDTLFAGSIGRTDLPGGNAGLLLRSIHSHLLPLPEKSRVIPGHGPETTIGHELQENPFLRGL